MSHFVVAVLSNTPEEVDSLLEPFCESTDNSKYLDFCTATETIDEMSAKYLHEKKPDERFEDFVCRWYGYLYNEELNEYGYLCNPNAKWDWWMTGGRWSKMLRLKSDALCFCEGDSSSSDDDYCDQAQICDIDFSPDPAEYAKALRFWEVTVEGSPLRDGENGSDFRSYFNEKYYLEQYGSKENYATEAASFSPWAVLTSEGEWIEKGAMGWFGFNDATQESRMSFRDKLKTILAENPDLYLTIVDCHI